MQEFTQTINRPEDLKNTKVNTDLYFYKTWKNKVMMNQFTNGACYHMDPNKPDTAAFEIAQKNKEIVHMIFQDGYSEDLSAENIAHFFGEFGDF